MEEDEFDSDEFYRAVADAEYDDWRRSQEEVESILRWREKWRRLAIREAYHVLPNGHVDPHHPQGEPSATP